jgi:hypothetical protein
MCLIFEGFFLIFLAALTIAASYCPLISNFLGEAQDKTNTKIKNKLDNFLSVRITDFYFCSKQNSGQK